MRLERHELELPTTADTDVLDLSQAAREFVAGSGIRDGWLLVFVPGSTGAVTTIEFESGAVQDLKAAIERLAPRDLDYAHDRRWGDGNGYSHVRAAIIGPQLLLPVAAGEIATGTWQQIVLCDFDNRPRRRRVLLQLLGE